MATNASSPQVAAVELYLDLLKKSLVRWGDDEFVPVSRTGRGFKGLGKRLLLKLIRNMHRQVVHQVPFDAAKREAGRDWPAQAITMIGMKRLDNIESCIKTVINEGIPGDLIETGIWRGGGCIFMRATLKALGDDTRIVWCADSFQGLPAPDTYKYPYDKGMIWHRQPQLAVSLDVVKENFKTFWNAG